MTASPGNMQGDDLTLDVSETSTPSPDASANDSTTPATSNGTSSASRRPPRKSTLTQQQKNQKRQRATQDQLITLEIEFNKNPTPTAAVRERIASEINMTERSVQIWFQNRRAKIKMIAKKSIDNGDECDSIPESMRQLLAMQAMEQGKPFARHLLGRSGIPMAPYGSGMVMGGDPNGAGKVVIHHFTCCSLSIGSWRRVGQNAMDLVIFYSPDKACITYYINNDSAGYKIEFPFAFIKNITLESGEPSPNHQDTLPRPGGLVIELTRPPNFFMDSSGSGGFFQCGDFTEDQQASQILVHHLGGHPKVLSGQLAKLVSLESFQNRHNPFGMNAVPASAPVSPNMGIVRPASQPTIHFTRPQPHVGMYQENHFGMSGGHLQPGRHGPPIGHKRQRSRSVPVAIDFNVLHSPMPTFHLQQPSPQLGQNPHQNLFQPQPIPPQMQGPGPIGPNLQIDTSSAYNMDMRQYPMSATASEASEYASPGFFAPPPSSTPMPAADYTTPYSIPYLSPSPMMDPHMGIPPSASPLSQMSHADPVIANQSPPLSGMHRSASAGIFNINDGQNFNDDTFMLNEMYSKQNLNIPMPSPGMDDNGMMALHDTSAYHTPRENMDEFSMGPFGTVDPHALSASHSQH